MTRKKLLDQWEKTQKLLTVKDPNSNKLFKVEDLLFITPISKSERCLTIGELKKAIASIPDDRLVSIRDTSGEVTAHSIQEDDEGVSLCCQECESRSSSSFDAEDAVAYWNNDNRPE